MSDNDKTMHIFYPIYGERGLGVISIDHETKNVTQKIRYGGTPYSTEGFFSLAPEIARMAANMKDDEIIVINNIDGSVGDGIFKDNYYTEYTDIQTTNPIMYDSVEEIVDFQFVKKKAALERSKEKEIQDLALFPEKMSSYDYHMEKIELKYKKWLDISKTAIERVANAVELPEPERVTLPFEDKIKFMNQTNRDIQHAVDRYKVARRFGTVDDISKFTSMIRPLISKLLAKKGEEFGISSNRYLFFGIVGEDDDILRDHNIAPRGFSFSEKDMQYGDAIYVSTETGELHKTPVYALHSIESVVEQGEAPDHGPSKYISGLYTKKSA